MRARRHVLPVWLRAFVRARESGIALVALVVGAASGLLVTGLGEFEQKMHEILFGMPHGMRLSLATIEPPWRIVAVIVGGGALLSLLGMWAGSRFKGRLADVIEANALHGGRMSVGGSMYITVQTVISNGCGASVGLEAAYTQICSAFSSLLGRGLAARRGDMRLLVACGSAGAISAAFAAPLTGAFYAFELVLGAYSVGSLVPVAASAVVASFVSRILSDHRLMSVALAVGPVNSRLFGHLVAVSLLASAVSVLMMMAVGAHRTPVRLGAAAGMVADARRRRARRASRHRSRRGCWARATAPSRWFSSRTSPAVMLATLAAHESLRLGDLARAPAFAAGCSSRRC